MALSSGATTAQKWGTKYGEREGQCLFYSPWHWGGGELKSSWRGNRIETGKILNPVQKISGGKLELLGGGWVEFPPKDA
jgi:hypothetical protein